MYAYPYYAFNKHKFIRNCRLEDTFGFNVNPPIPEEEWLERFFNLEKINKKINEEFAKRTTKEKLVNEKKYHLKLIFTDGYSCALVFEKKIDSQMIVKRKEKALEDSIPKIAKRIK